MENIRTTAIVLAAGQGKRMHSAVSKQYLLLRGKPVLYYALKAFETSAIHDIVLVVGKGEEAFCHEEFCIKYGFCKIRTITEGGRERYHSVANGLQAITWNCDYVFIHDGARPFIDNELIIRAYNEVIQTKACVVGMPVKDTIKISDENGYVEQTPVRSRAWQIQTPQVFEKNLIKSAYKQLLDKETQLEAEGITVTDDAMVVEYFTNIPVKLVEGSYKNIKITTPEDLQLAEIYVKETAQTLENKGFLETIEKK